MQKWKGKNRDEKNNRRKFLSTSESCSQLQIVDCFEHLRIQKANVLNLLSLYGIEQNNKPLECYLWSDMLSLLWTIPFNQIGTQQIHLSSDVKDIFASTPQTDNSTSTLCSKSGWQTFVSLSNKRELISHGGEKILFWNAPSEGENLQMQEKKEGSWHLDAILLFPSLRQWIRRNAAPASSTRVQSRYG